MTDRAKIAARSLQDRTTLVSAPAPGGGPIVEEYVHQLVVIEGAEHGRIVEVGEQPVTIGRSVPSEVVLRDVEMSRSHCRVFLESGEVVVTDLASTNGTYIDGRKVTGHAVLGSGGFLQVGRHVLKYERRNRRESEQSREFDRSLEGASRYIQSLLPAPITDGPVRADWLLLPSTRLGGDALGYHCLSDGSFALYLLDVSGHGVEAAMLAVAVMNALRQKALPDVDAADPAQVIDRLNATFSMDAHGLMYFTIWYGVFEPSRRTLTYCSAGHHPAYLVPESKSAITALHTPNVAVGVVPDFSYASASVSVPPNSNLYLFSDGVFEILTTEGKRWELQDFLPLLEEPSVDGVAEPRRLYQAVHRVARRGPLEDDFSLLVASFT